MNIKLRLYTQKILILSIIFSVFFLLVYFNFRPIIKIISVNTAKSTASQIINQSVLEELSNNNLYSEIVKLQYNQTGELVGLFSDMEKLNKLKSKVSILIQEKLSNFKNKKIYVPIGTLTGIEIFNGIGPDVPINISIIGSISSEFKSNFQSSGINQTIYKIYLNICTRISVIVPGCSSIEDCNTNILISETVVLGNVPKAYSMGSSIISEIS